MLYIKIFYKKKHTIKYQFHTKKLRLAFTGILKILLYQKIIRIISYIRVLLVGIKVERASNK